MIELKTPRALTVQVPLIDAEDPYPKFDASDFEGVSKYYELSGYAIVRGLITAAR